jgi:Ca2+-binding EF-hand superfamily protein
LEKAESVLFVKNILKECGEEKEFTNEAFIEFFTKWDENNDGKISKAEMKNFIKHMLEEGV